MATLLMDQTAYNQYVEDVKASVSASLAASNPDDDYAEYIETLELNLPSLFLTTFIDNDPLTKTRNTILSKFPPVPA